MNFFLAVALALAIALGVVLARVLFFAPKQTLKKAISVAPNS